MKLIIYLLICGLIPWRLLAQDFTNIKSQKPFAFNGSLELRGAFYGASGISNRMEPFNYYVSGSPIISLYGWSIPFSITWSQKQTSFQQPFNQFGLSPTYKWITLHAGYRNVKFSPYTLAGHTILGGGVELNPGKLRLGFMHGKLNRATVIDTMSMSLVPYSFSRKGTAVKLGYGSHTNFFDLNFLHAKDDSTSVAPLIVQNNIKVNPASNSVLGYATKFTLINKLFFESDGAISLLTRDVNSPLSIDSIENKTLRKFSDLLDINGTSEWFLAFNGGIGYREKNYGIKLNYRRVEPGFTSMGAYYFSNDIENFTINPNYSHPSGKFSINGSLGVERDNVRLQKEATSKRIIGSGNISSQLSQNFGVDINFNNYSNNQSPNTLKFADSLKIVQTTRTIGIMPRYSIVNKEHVQMILLSANFSNMNDYNSYFDNGQNNTPSRDIKTGQYLLSYSISMPKKKLSLNSSLSYTNLESELNKNNYKGISVGGNYILLKDQLTTGANVSFMIGDSNANKSNIFNGNVNFGYRINKLQSLRAMVYFMNNNPGSAVIGGNPAFSETRGEIAYQLNFGL